MAKCTHLTVIERGLSCGVAAGHKVGPSDGKQRFRRRGQTAFIRLPTDRGQALVHRIQQQPRRGWCVATDAEDEGSLVGRLGLRDSDWRGHGRRVAAARVQPKVKTGASGGCSLAPFLVSPDVGCRWTLGWGWVPPGKGQAPDARLWREPDPGVRLGRLALAGRRGAGWVSPASRRSGNRTVEHATPGTAGGLGASRLEVGPFTPLGERGST